ncbi:MAG: extracellular solute-binding protein [Acetobacteraceae bacterium]|nr:extracellular solute-binding protein [Acetobacteraceae bacterium]
MELSRRSILTTLAAGAAALATDRAFAEAGDLQSIYEAAKKEGQVTWYSGFLNQTICADIGNAFSQKYPGITVNATKTTSQVAFQRLLQDMKGGRIESDIFSSTDLSHMAFLQKKSLLIHFDPPNAKGIVPALRDLDPKGDYYPGWLGVGAIGYNTSKLSAAEAPQDWSDLTDPKWKDKETFGSPIYSGVVGNWTVALTKLYGWDFFKKLNALNPLIGRSFDDSITVLNSGERLVGLANIAAVARTAAKGNPLAVNYPTSGTLVVPSATAIIAGCKSPNAAKLFLDFACGPEYSKILAENFEVPLRGDVAPPKGIKSLSDVKTLTPTLQDVETMLPDTKSKWKDTFS